MEVNKVFTPTAPVDERKLFAGRSDQLSRIIEVVAQKGQHAIIFGERGVGKTSLTNILGQVIRGPAGKRLSLTMGPRATSEARDTYSSLWRKVFAEIAVTENRGKIGFSGEKTLFQESVADRLPEEITPDIVRRTLSQLGEGRILIVIIDEFDRLPDEVSTAIADTIKALSDHATPATVVLVGVADSVGQLIRDHASVERALVQIPMPRMSGAEIREIIDRGLDHLSMTMTEQARERVVLLAQGLPHYAHLLGLHSVLDAMQEETTEVGTDHIVTALSKAVDDTQMSIRDAYSKAVASPRSENLYKHVLLACALAPTDDLGYFTPAVVRDPMSALMGKHYDIPSYARHLYDFTEADRGPVLERTGSERKYRYRFKNPLLQPYIIMRGLADHLLEERVVAALHPVQAR